MTITVLRKSPDGPTAQPDEPARHSNSRCSVDPALVVTECGPGDPGAADCHENCADRLGGQEVGRGDVDRCSSDFYVLGAFLGMATTGAR